MNKHIKQELRQNLASLRTAKRGEIPAIAFITAGLFGVLLLGLVVVVFQIILGQFGANTTLAPANSFAANAITSTQTSVATVPTWFTVIITVIVAVALILIVMLIRYAGQAGGGDHGGAM